MKIGITLSENYRKYLHEIANLNNMSPTAICSIIVENYLSFNKEKGRNPIFTKKYAVVYADKQQKEIVDESGKRIQEEQILPKSREEIIASLDKEAEDYIENADGGNNDELPF